MPRKPLTSQPSRPSSCGGDGGRQPPAGPGRCRTDMGCAEAGVPLPPSLRTACRTAGRMGYFFQADPGTASPAGRARFAPTA
eukprot:353884-Chlamydomonas_euryale.AAC.1